MRNFIDTQNFCIQSTGLFSSWCLHKPSRTLFDCGDGVALELGYKVFNPERIIFSHSHIDHISGFLSFIGIRCKTKGDNYKPLDIYYPKGDKVLKRYIDFALSFYGKLKFKVSVYEVENGGVINIGKNTYIKAFKTAHTKYSLGYVYCQASYKLKSEIDPKSVKNLIDSGVSRDSLTVRHDTKLFAYTLDNCLFDIEEIRDVQEVILDATFVKDEDRQTMSHATFDNCVWIVKNSNAKKAYFAHLSPRYNHESLPELPENCYVLRG